MKVIRKLPFKIWWSNSQCQVFKQVVNQTIKKTGQTTVVRIQTRRIQSTVIMRNVTDHMVM